MAPMHSQQGWHCNDYYERKWLHSQRFTQKTPKYDLSRKLRMQALRARFGKGDGGEVNLQPPRGPQNLPYCFLNIMLACRCGPYRSKLVLKFRVAAVVWDRRDCAAVWVPNPAITGQSWDAVKEFERLNSMRCCDLPCLLCLSRKLV